MPARRHPIVQLQESFVGTPVPFKTVTSLSTGPGTSTLKNQHAIAFNPEVYLGSAGTSRRIVEFRHKKLLFAQGDIADSVMFIQQGKVKLTVLNEVGREAVVGIFGPGEFLGEGCMSGQKTRIGTATAVVPTTVLIIAKEEMVRVLHEESELSDRFITCMLARSTRVEADLIDQLFNSTEKRLARTLLLLAHYGEDGKPGRVLHEVSQGMLAEMIGSTRTRVNLFMTKFRKLGFIDYDGEIMVNKSLLNVVLHE